MYAFQSSTIRLERPCQLAIQASGQTSSKSCARTPCSFRRTMRVTKLRTSWIDTGSAMLRPDWIAYARISWGRTDAILVRVARGLKS
ncbi:MAG: hypothetical protein A2Z17_06700 [Gammaproteobacteria bacterium RBG_16_66_13]|nr:MAG: hypothetical protein A2Z17_06700 [Gammaproteobacteria bacterium RBG_16_66_13]